MTRIYVSGPMTGLPEYNFPSFQEAARQLRAAGYSVEDPSEKGIIDGWTWADYLRFDIKALMDCDGVAVLPGWPKSKGARLEVTVAEELGMQVMSVDSWIREAVRAA